MWTRMLSLLCITHLLCLCCSCNEKKTDNSEISFPTYTELDPTTELQTIAFGSCNRQDLPQPMWEFIVANNPDLWIWLGDNIYGDSEDTAVLSHKYQQQNANEGYQTLLTEMPILGIWDDHDYGVNDGGKEYAQKALSRDLMFDFLNVPNENPAWQREGAYQAYNIGTADKQVKIILLDARYFRDGLEKNPLLNPRYFPNDTGDILGEAQWQWLENELLTSTAQVHLIASGIQMIPEEHAFEKWANFPKAHQRLKDLLHTTQPKNLLLLSGDRHITEVSKLTSDTIPTPIYEFTSSGLTHSYEQVSGEPNQWRISPLVGEKNFGLLKIDWTKTPIELKIEMKGLENKTFYETKLTY